MGFDLLSGSFFYRLLGRILDGIEQSARQSRIVRIIQVIRLWAKSSFLVRICTHIADAFGASLRNSAIIGRLLKEDETGRYKERGLVFRGYTAILSLLRRIYRALRLDKLLRDSITQKTYIWATLAFLTIPILPTMAVLGLVALSMGSLLLALLQDQTRTLTYSAVNKYVWLYMLVYGLATLVSVTFWGSLQIGLITVFFVGFYHVLVSGIETKGQLRFLIGALAFAGAFVGLIGILQFLGFIGPGLGAAAWLDDEMFDWGLRVYSTLGNPNVLGTYFLLIIPLTFAGMFISQTNQGRLYFLGTAGVMCLCLLLTLSRGAYLGILFVAATFCLLLDRRFLVPGILAAILLLLAMPEAILHRFFSIGDLADTSTNYRVFIWLGTLEMLRDYWFSGIGPGEAAWALVYPAYAFATIVTPHSHNLFLQITSDAGAPGLVVFLCVIYQFFKTTFATLRRTTGSQRILTIAPISSVVAFLVMSMTDYTFYNFRVMLFFWAILAVGILATRYDKLREGGEDT
ncbi:MAG: O-antigen ligase family protein [Oscillospiraceae bacterium]|nr:O-antigen ligase family protein [Oscillospiraceae bacterium]